MKYLIYGFIASVLFIPFSVNAAKCSDAQVSRYEQLANQIQTTFEYNETEEGLTFDILFHNVTDELYLIDSYTYENTVKYENDADNLIIASGYSPNTTVKFMVLNYNNVCNATIIKRIYVTLPSYNKYYRAPVCNDITEFELCQKWANIGKISYDNFLLYAEQYKTKKKQQEQILEPNEIEESVINNIRNFLAKYYLYIIIGGVVISSFIVYFWNKRKRYTF